MSTKTKAKATTTSKPSSGRVSAPPKINVNWTDDPLFETLPVGIYRIRIISIEEKKAGPDSSNPGMPFLSVTWKVVEGEHKGKTVLQSVMYAIGKDKKGATVNYERQLRGWLLQLGIEIEKTGLEKFNTGNLIGTEAYGDIKHREWNGRTYADIKSLRTELDDEDEDEDLDDLDDDEEAESDESQGTKDDDEGDGEEDDDDDDDDDDDEEDEDD